MSFFYRPLYLDVYYSMQIVHTKSTYISKMRTETRLSSSPSFASRTRDGQK
ncbi:unnamed protein product [Penicillium roqueforti FM164]|uniref:Genomic scaffold, ProqFM164S02 n=1 Tax=Penicillium roqueforti (strain FM164) TaxID=1365484 RepID=W6Q8N4_PENRF|nr:unnamed protein product [Penicillium roqueforti FM164]